jgi:hypothetical protein
MSEQAIQRAIASYLDISLPDDVFYTAVNPIPGKTPAAGAISQAMGMKAGVPDLLLCFNGKFVGIEVKKEGGYLDKKQKVIHAHITHAGGRVFTARSIDDVQEILADLGVELKGIVT